MGSSYLSGLRGSWREDGQNVYAARDAGPIIVGVMNGLLKDFNDAPSVSNGSQVESCRPLTPDKLVQACAPVLEVGAKRRENKRIPGWPDCKASQTLGSPCGALRIQETAVLGLYKGVLSLKVDGIIATIPSR